MLRRLLQIETMTTENAKSTTNRVWPIALAHAILEIRNPKRDDTIQRRCSCLCAPAGLFCAPFQRREAAHWAIGRLQAVSG